MKRPMAALAAMKTPHIAICKYRSLGGVGMFFIGTARIIHRIRGAN